MIEFVLKSISFRICAVEVMMDHRSAPMNIQELQLRVQEFAAAAASVLLVYLFGSQASGQASPGSDYDLGVLLDRREDSPARRARLTHELVVRLGTVAVDVVFLRQTPPELAFAVIQGQLLYARDLAARVEYEAYVMGRYYDYLPYLRAQRQEILSGEDHGARIQRYREAFGRTERTLREIRAAQEQKQG
jgi:predicted nucleotidyltransferase